MHRTDTGALIAGASAGITGLLAFLALHALWIVPIWFILPVGLLLAGSGGLAVGWAYAELKSRLPRRPWTALAVVGMIALILLPAVVLAELHGPVFSVTPAGPVQTVATSVIVTRFVGELLATGVAGFVFALGPGHNIPLIGGTPGVGKELAIMTAVTFVAALVLVEGHAWLATRRSERRD